MNSVSPQEHKGHGLLVQSTASELLCLYLGPSPTTRGLVGAVVFVSPGDKSMRTPRLQSPPVRLLTLLDQHPHYPFPDNQIYTKIKTNSTSTHIPHPHTHTFSLFLCQIQPPFFSPTLMPPTMEQMQGVFDLNMNPIATHDGYPRYARSETKPVVRARHIIDMGAVSDRPCSACVELGQDCYRWEEGRFGKCAYCTSKDRKKELCCLPGLEAEAPEGPKRRKM